MEATPLDMEVEKIRNLREKFGELSDLQKDGFFLGIVFLVIASTAAVHNLNTPDEPVKVGYVEVETNCAGFEAGNFCIGAERQSHTTYNYDDYKKPEPGTENFYRKVESELMAQAYNICTEGMSGMEWTSRAEYRNQTGKEWLENENVQLLPCDQTFYRNMTAAR